MSGADSPLKPSKIDVLMSLNSFLSHFSVFFPHEGNITGAELRNVGKVSNVLKYLPNLIVKI